MNVLKKILAFICIVMSCIVYFEKVMFQEF